ncbi:putative cytochrome P450 [Helianthus annuus]|uniref:Cytochrome P450 n=1 Tax=Helianthus annuus TaxID=4232 RepID=A0A9K3JJE4_HELAN|nr:cytochrome P450 87A3 [Helianthus annuus]KAF5816114.1 putative cytochrome P450 [Helianthus annuus]KAJ0602651.1 putative cytochrome P450 [Helianthus annuus]KAJ0945386.1 putative cytochrome P450 [Helianthus annuus]
MWQFSLYVLALAVASITHLVYRWRNPKCSGKLPPGSMGWPLLGETLQFFAPNRTWDIPPFVKERMTRYGSIFRTSFVGLPVIVSTDPDLNHMVFQQEGQLFQSWYPYSLRQIYGKQNASTLHGYLHKHLKNMMLNLFGHGSLKNMLSDIESVATRNIEMWVGQGTVELKDATADMVFGLTAKKLISYDLEKSSENLRENFDAFLEGLLSVPVAIPGTTYYKCLQGRKKVMRILKNMLEERKQKPSKVKVDFFDHVLEELKHANTILTEEIALDLMFVLLFTSFETAAMGLLVAIKLLTDNPRALKELTEEHEKILKERENLEAGLTWEEYKSMTFTFQIINETVRLANIVPAIFRKALTDIKIKDYTIPSGWVVMVSLPAVHLDPVNYKDPLDFNPWRWEGMGMKGASKNFMAFGGGQRFCVGADFARLQMAVFLHCLVTKYRWQPIKGGETLRTPGLQFPNGFHVKFFKKDYKMNQDPKSELANYPKQI